MARKIMSAETARLVYLAVCRAYSLDPSQDELIDLAKDSMGWSDSVDEFATKFRREVEKNIFAQSLRKEVN